MASLRINNPAEEYNTVVVRLCLFLIVLISAACHSNQKSNPIKGDSTEVLTETELPPGRPALEDAPPAVLPVEDGAALGSDTKKPTDISRLDQLPEETLRKKFKNLLVFHADDTMEVNTPKLATLILSRDESINKLRVEVLDESETTEENIKLDTLMEFGSKMKARLIPFGSSRLESTFNIEALGDDVQSFKTDRKKILWQWKITPLKPGQQELKLSIQIIEKDGETVSLPARNIPVTIFAKPESYVTQAGDFLKNYWQFLITAIMVPLLSAWVANLIKNRPAKSRPTTSAKLSNSSARKHKPTKTPPGQTAEAEDEGA